MLGHLHGVSTVSQSWVVLGATRCGDWLFKIGWLDRQDFRQKASALSIK